MFSAVILLAGSGRRSLLSINKTLYKLGDKPMFMYSYEKFKSMGAEVILVVSESDYEEVKSYNLDAKITIGGASRAESSYNGVKEAYNDLVLIHDAARPFFNVSIINEMLKVMENAKCAYTGIKVVDTIRDTSKSVIDRDRLMIVQTPQALYKNDYLEAYKNYNGDKILTDDISYLEEYFKYKPEVVLGSRFNFKITTPEDIKLALCLIREDLDD